MVNCSHDGGCPQCHSSGSVPEAAGSPKAVGSPKALLQYSLPLHYLVGGKRQPRLLEPKSDQE